MDYKVTITQEFVLDEVEHNKLYSTINGTKQRILLVHDNRNIVHMLDWNYVTNCDWQEHSGAMVRPTTLPEEK